MAYSAGRMDHRKDSFDLTLPTNDPTSAET